MHHLVLAILLLALFAPATVSAKGKWTTFTNPDYINSVVQEGDTLWCATQGGIVRYDTKTDTFRVFTRDDGLHENKFSKVYIGRNGTKWFNNSALVCQEGDVWKYRSPADADTLFNGSWIHIKACTPYGIMLIEGQKWYDDIRHIDVYALFNGETWTECPHEYDDTGASVASPEDFWYVYSNFAVRFNNREVVFYSYRSSPAGMVRSLAKDHDNIVWFISNKGVISYDCTTWKTHTPLPELEDRKLGSVVYVDRNNVKWFPTDRGFITFDGTIWKLRDVPGNDPTSFAESFFEDRVGNLWVGTRRGLWKFDGTTWKNFTHDIQVRASTLSQSMRIHGDDSRGRIWFSYDPVFHPGLFSCDDSGIMYHSLQTGPSYNTVTCITVSQNNTKWFGFTSIAYLCPQCYKAGGISSFDGNIWKQYSTDDGLYYNRIKSLAVDQDGVLWAGTDFSHICWFDGSAWNVNHDAYVIPDGMYSIAVDKYNVKWFTAPIRGIMRYDGTEWILFDKTSGIPDINVRALVVDRDNILWAGTNGGIWNYDGSSWKSYTMADGLPDSLIACAAVDSANVKWFGSQRPAGGLISFDGNAFRQYTDADGLVGNVITAITVDKDNVKWIGTNVGVSRFDGTTWTNFTMADGLTSNNVSSIAVDHDGIVWIGTDDGISRLEPDFPTPVAEERESRPIPLAITGNYPNPFNPSTTISFSLPAPGRVNLSIYSITGQKVRELLSDDGSYKSYGTYTIIWDGRDDSGEPVSSGVYLYRLTQGKHAAVGRMALVK
jgi:ligand-binding sensor domain-containing protein